VLLKSRNFCIKIEFTLSEASFKRLFISFVVVDAKIYVIGCFSCSIRRLVAFVILYLKLLLLFVVDNFASRWTLQFFSK